MNITVGSVSASLDTKPILEKLDKAHWTLNKAVVRDSTPLVPLKSGRLRGSVSYPDINTIQWSTPYAHYQWRGINRFTGAPLHYHTAGTGSEWVNKAKGMYMSQWTEEVKAAVK